MTLRLGCSELEPALVPSLEVEESFVVAESDASLVPSFEVESAEDQRGRESVEHAEVVSRR